MAHMSDQTIEQNIKVFWVVDNLNRECKYR